jgi:hypothetical protein
MNILFISILLSVLSNNPGRDNFTDTASQKMTIPIVNIFSNVVIYDNVTVYITEGDQNEIIVNNAADADNLKIKVKDEVLIIKSKKGILSNSKPVKVFIMVRNIHGITIMGDSEVRTIGELSCRNLKLEIYGDGAIYASTKANEVNTFIKGLGKIEVKGNFKNTSVNKDAYGNMTTTYN